MLLASTLEAISSCDYIMPIYLEFAFFFKSVKLAGAASSFQFSLLSLLGLAHRTVAYSEMRVHVSKQKETPMPLNSYRPAQESHQRCRANALAFLQKRVLSKPWKTTCKAMILD